MPRLLLVDDNPSIHKIAETLLATSDVQLVSCASGAQAMGLVEQGERFDVALLDTSMMGMDGWALLKRLRDTEATARMPVAMMAGVLDIVDPEKLRLAPIQGFLKKPVELRDLGERVHRLMETPVAPPVVQPPPTPQASFITQTALRVPEELKKPAPETEDDLLLLGPEDLFEEPAAEPAQAPMPGHGEPEPAPSSLPEPEAHAETLDLEELDLESLRNLSFSGPEAEPEAAPVPVLEPLPEPVPEPAEDVRFTVPEFLLTDTLPDITESLSAELPDLGPAPESKPAEIATGLLDWTDDSDSMVAQPALESAHRIPTPPAMEPPPPAPITVPAPFEPVPPSAALAAEHLTEAEFLPGDAIVLSDLLEEPEPAAALPATHAAFTPPAPVPGTPAATPLVPATAMEPLPAEHGLPEPGSETADPLAALLADSVLMDRLARAVVARLGDQVLREIAWDVIPELMERIRPKEAR
jgi:CheY-like chemotaxis protein